MEKVRIGNDMRVNFSVYRNGEPESFDGASNIVTKLVNEAYNKLITHTYTIAGNIVQFDIDALQLTQCGKCRLFISYTKGGDYTVDSPAFELVNYTDQTGGTEIIGVEIVSINISGDIGINRDGASAYEVWESYPGNEGKTIEEYFTWLRENPTKIDLDGLNSNLQKLHFNTAPTATLTNPGDIRYSSESNALELQTPYGYMTLGRNTHSLAKNDTGTTLLKGEVVYIYGAVGANALARRATNTDVDVAVKTFGLVLNNTNANNTGGILTEGTMRNLNTLAWTEGSMLWLGVNGAITITEPTAPTGKVSLGMVLRSHANEGVIYVKIVPIYRMSRLTDVYAPTPTGGDILRFNSTTLRFEVFNITTALSAKTDTSISIIAGAGLTGGGTFAADRTINIVNTDDSIVVSADSIKVNTNNTLTSTSTTQPLSANQGKVLNEKVVQVETDLNTDIDQVRADLKEMSDPVNTTLKYELDIYENILVNQNSTISGKYINASGNIVSLVGYSIKVYQISENTPFRIIGKNSGIVASHAFYADENLTVLVKIGNTYSITGAHDVNIIDTVPKDALYVGVTIDNNYSLNLYLANKNTTIAEITNNRFDALNLVQSNYFFNNRFPNDTYLNVLGAQPKKDREEFYYFLPQSSTYESSVPKFNYWGRSLKISVGESQTNFYFSIPSVQIIHDEYFKLSKNLNINFEMWVPDAKKATIRIYKDVNGVQTQIAIKSNVIFNQNVNVFSFENIDMTDANFGMTSTDHIQIRIFPLNNGSISWVNGSFNFGRINVFSGVYSKSLDFVNNYNQTNMPSVQALIDSNKVNSHWFGAKLVTLGDSISFQQMWQPEVVRRTGVVYNYLEATAGTNGHMATALGGSTITPYITGFSGQNAGQSIYYRADDVKYYTPNVITLFGGQNDLLTMGRTLGTIDEVAYKGPEVSSNPPSFIASYKGVVEKLITQNPTALIILITPAWSSGETFAVKKSKCDAIEQIGYLYGLPVINLLKDSGINSINQTLFLSDTVHPNQAGGKMIGGLVSQRLL